MTDAITWLPPDATATALETACQQAEHGPVPVMNRDGEQIGAVVSLDDAAAVERFRAWYADITAGREPQPGPCSPGPGVGC